MADRNVPTPSSEVQPGSAETATQQYFDGASGVAIGPAVSRVHFHQVVRGADASNATELRKITLVAVVPTLALVELCTNFLAAVRKNSDTLRQQIDAQTEMMLKR
jgi:hypothetical protein